MLTMPSLVLAYVSPLYFHIVVYSHPRYGRPVTKLTLTPNVLALVADRLKVLAEPARLQILNAIRNRELTVSEIIDATGLGQTNVSKHLQLLHTHGFVSRRKEGLFTYYSLADRHVFKLCELMCDSIDQTTAARRRTLAS